MPSTKANNYILYMGFPSGSLVKNPPAIQETWAQSLGQEDHLEKEMATNSSILAWRIPQTKDLAAAAAAAAKSAGYNP